MATYGQYWNQQNRPGQYQIGGTQFDIDPAWTDILYGPLTDKVDSGFQIPSTVPGVAPVEELETPTTQNNDANENNGAGGDGGVGGWYDQMGIDPNSGLAIDKNINYSYPDWWAGWTPNVTLTDAIKQFAPIAAKFHTNPIGTVIGAMKLDPINDKTLQREIASYLEDVGSVQTLDDIIGAYKALTKTSSAAKMNMSDTIRGLVIGANPQYKDAFDQSVRAGFEAHDFGKAMVEANEYNRQNPELSQIDMTMTVDPRTRSWAVPQVTPAFSILDTYRQQEGNSGVIDQVNRDYNPYGLTNNLTNALDPFGTNWGQLREDWTGEVITDPLDANFNPNRIGEYGFSGPSAGGNGGRDSNGISSTQKGGSSTTDGTPRGLSGSDRVSANYDSPSTGNSGNGGGGSQAANKGGDGGNGGGGFGGGRGDSGASSSSGTSGGDRSGEEGGTLD